MKNNRASERYANLDIHRELQYRNKIDSPSQDNDIDKKSNLWSSIKRKVSMTSLASHTISSVSTATKRTKKSSFSSVEPEKESSKDSDKEQEKPASGLKRSATVSHSVATQTRKPVHRKKVAVDDTAIDDTQRKVKRPPSSLVLGFFDPDNGIAIGRYNIAHKKTFSKTERKKKNRENCEYFYEPNTALAFGKSDDFGSFPESRLKSPLSRSRSTKHKRLSKSNDNIEENLPVCESQPKASTIRRRLTSKAKKTKTEEKAHEAAPSKPVSKKVKMRNKLTKAKQTKTYKCVNGMFKICTCRCSKL